MARILLTGASSFSGLWIAQALAAAGHSVVAPLRRPLADYEGLRLGRVQRLQAVAEVAFDHALGSSRLLDLAGAGRFELLAHHAADIPNYRDADYDVAQGLARNVAGAPELLDALAGGGARGVIVTGTTFEMGEGEDDPGSLAVSPYGLSKGLTNQAWRHLARWRGLQFGKFVVAAPFGRWEEGRLVWSLAQSWMDGRPGVVRTPRYVRDNLPAPLLGQAYARLAQAMLEEGAAETVSRPAGFIGPQGAFARRVAAAFAPRLGLACEVEEAPQPALTEPEVRVNDQPALDPAWPEESFWDDYAAYYAEVAERGLLRNRPA